MPEREIDLPGVGNARELGGLKTENGMVRRGVLIRTAALGQAAPAALERLKDRYRVQTIVDLRMSSERRSAPDPAVEGAGNLFLPVAEMEDLLEKADPAMAKMFREGRIDIGDRMKTFEMTYESGMLGNDMYLQFLLTPRGIGGWRRFFRALTEAEDGRAVLWHCTDGKDRTGCGAMLILYALGADRETVMEDYLQTNQSNERKLASVRGRMEPAGMPEDKLKVLLFMSGGVFADYMDRAIDALNGRYGSVMGYITGELGVTEQEIDLLREKYLEKESS